MRIGAELHSRNVDERDRARLQKKRCPMQDCPGSSGRTGQKSYTLVALGCRKA